MNLLMKKRYFLKQIAKFKRVPIITRLFVFSALCCLFSLNMLVFSYNPAYAIKLQHLCKQGKFEKPTVFNNLQYDGIYNPTGKIGK